MTTVLVTYWNENNNKTKELEIFSTWDAESIKEDATNWLDANDGLKYLKEEDGEFDWFEITKIITK